MTTPLNADRIREALSDEAQQQLECIDVLDVVTSTNSILAEQPNPEIGRYKIVLAEQQTAGRGRHGKQWVSPRGAGLYLSIAHTFNMSPEHLSCLTLAAGIATLKALEKVGAENLSLKWPNDIYGRDAKLGGILTDAQIGRGGHTCIVCGIGINHDHSTLDTQAGLSQKFDYPVTDLRNHCDDLPERSALAAAIIEQVMSAIALFETSGLDAFRADWNHSDWLHGKAVDVDMPGEEFDGTADGIDANGALRVLTPQGMRCVHTGTVRVRGASAL